MKKLFFAALIAMSITACTKYEVDPDLKLQVGNTYHFKNDVFNKGAYQPVNDLKLDELYIDRTSGLPYARVHAKINWASFALDTKGGAGKQTVEGNKITLAGLQAEGIDYGYPEPVEWYFPQYDLKK